MEKQGGLDDAGLGPVPRTTFHGPAKWASSHDQVVIDSVLNSEASLKCTLNLLPSAIKENFHDANVDYTGCHRKLVELCLLASWDHITSKVYDQLCPHFINDPVTIIYSIHQEYYLSEDSTQMVTQTVEEYFKTIQQMTNFLPKKGKWPLDVTLHFNTHLVDDVKHQMTVSNYKYIASNNDDT
eukprot:3476776-Ditylum_brightwellii.AAC.1